MHFGTQLPAMQCHPAPEPQGDVSATAECRQPLPASHQSLVQAFESLQSSGTDPTHPPPLHLSTVVHLLESSQGNELFECLHPSETTHQSVVQIFPSSQLGGGPPEQFPFLHASEVVQAFPSLHGNELFLCKHACTGSHESSVHGLPSLQLNGDRPTHLPPAHLSTVVHLLASSQGLLFVACRHPVAGSQLSLVHRLPSSQLGGELPMQNPPEHLSTVVQAFPSLQAAWLFLCMHPATGSHQSSEHTLASLQFTGAMPTQLPEEHLSVAVQTLLSSHGTELGVKTQPVFGAQESSVHKLLSAHFFAWPGRHTLRLQVSPTVQAFPSSQGTTLAACAHPFFGSHESSVQVFPSSQLKGSPGTQLPLSLHASPSVQALPSLHGPGGRFECTHPTPLWQKS